MVPLPELLAFVVAAIVIIAIPGPSVLFVIGRSLAFGRRGGLLSVLGNDLGVLPLVAAVALGLGTVTVVISAFLWWRDVLKESRTAGMHTPIVRLGLRYGMTLFISSEVMFFVGFFWAWFHFALYPGHVSGAEVAVWPPAGTLTFNPWHLPFLNTLILLLSGTTITWAHHALLQGDRKHLIMGLGFTILLGLTFTALQAVEYAEAPFAFSGGGVYTSVFFLATGFHGFHVIVGTIFLIVCWFRARSGGFSPTRHFGFEAAAWYWHFVDVVWLFLFLSIYVWGGWGAPVHAG